MGFELIASGIAHRFGPLQVLDDINFNVKQGEIVAIVGPSGCGKSTLLGIIGGLIQPSHGTVSVVGALPAGSLNPFTYIFQDFALLPWRTVAQNVRLPLEHHPLTGRERDQRVKETLRLTGLEDFARALPKQLSGGMKQRVGIARALVVEPAVLLMDEPFSALDIQTRQLMENELLELWAGTSDGRRAAPSPPRAPARGGRAAGGEHIRKAVLFITHDLDEAIAMSDRVIVLSAGPAAHPMGEFIIDLPRPRDVAEVRVTPRFVDLHKAIWDVLRDEVLKGYAQQKLAA